MSQETQSGDRKNRAGSGSTILRVCVALMIYAASSGPAMWLHARMTTPGMKTALYAAYAPVVVLINTPPLNGVGAWWVYQWVDVPESRTWLPFER